MIQRAALSHASIAMLAGAAVFGSMVGVWTTLHFDADLGRAIPHAVVLGLGFFALPGIALAFAKRHAGAMVWSIQLSVLGYQVRRAALDGDGIRSHASFDILANVAWLGVLAAAVAGAIAWVGGTRSRHAIGIGGLVCVLATLRLPPTYSDLAFFSMASGVACVGFWVVDHVAQRSQRALAVLGLLAPMFMFLGRVDFPRALNIALLPGVPTPGIFGDPRHVQRRQQQPPGRVGTPDGNHVVVIVIESVRWNRWSVPEVAPNFARWRRHGTYFPNAIAQYPATPLAYGAMFVSQPPNVLVRTTQWTHYRPLDVARPMFDHLYLSRPNESWFADDAIVGFVTAAPDVHTHTTSEDALAGLRSFLDAHAQSRTFSWVHLYEPHQPWQQQPGFTIEKPPKTMAYDSELRYVDHHLGAFFDWFYERPEFKDALVIVIGDHGQGLGETIDGRPYFGHHVNVTTGVAWIPLYLSGPRIPIDTVAEGNNVGQLDVMPTVFDYLGLPMPANLHAQGHAIQSQIQEPQPRALPTEAFALRGRSLFDLVRRSRTGIVTSSQLQAAVSLGRYPPKLALQLGDLRLIMNRNTREIRPFSTKDGNETPVALEDPEELERLVETWEAEQNWVVERLNQAETPAPQ